MEDPSDRSAKVIFLGDNFVGKTSILIQYHQGIFEDSTNPTIGVSYINKTVVTKRGKVSLSIWDTAGQERFRNIIPAYLRGCSAAILVTCVGHKTHIQSLQQWLELLITHQQKATKIYIVLNKCDLAETEDDATVEEWANHQNFPFFKTSAKDRASVDALFNKIALDYAETNQKSYKETEAKVKLTDEPQKSGCC